MGEINKDYAGLIEAFHQTWDGFPGASRLIDKNNLTVAVNRFAKEHGMEAGQICARMATPERHRGCLKHVALATGKAQVDRPSASKIRGWLPVEDYPDIVVHFSLEVPDINENGK